MDGVSWSTTRPPESFSRSKTTTDTLTRLASFIARADAKQQRAQRPQTSLLSSHVCQECDQGFTRSADLLHHQEVTHTLPKPHSCKSCGRGFSLRSSLQLHRCDHGAPSCVLCHGASPLSSPCPACMSRGADPIRLQNMLPHLQPCLLDNTPYACAPCGRGFSQKQALLHHQQAGCSEPPSPSRIIDVSSLPDDLPPVSEAGSAHSGSAQSDSSMGQSLALNKCEVCSRSFHTETGFQRHIETTHGEELLSTTQGPPTKGGGGGGGSLCLNGAAVKKSHAKHKLLSCRSCDLVFRSTSKLYLHRKEKHSREKILRKEPRPMGIRRRRAGAYPCQVCGKVFLHHLSLRAHYRHHSELSYTTARDARHSELSYTAPRDARHSELSYTAPRDARHSELSYTAPRDARHSELSYTAPRDARHSELSYTAARDARHSELSYTAARDPRHSELSYTAPRDAQAPDRGAKDSEVAEDRSDAVTQTSEGSKTIGAGPGRPRKLNSGWGCEVPVGIQREVPEKEEEQEEEEDRILEEEEEEEEEGEFACPSCPEVFSVQSQLRDHVELHQSSVRWRCCSVCTNAMDTKKRPRSKRKRLYHCVPCQQGFSQMDSFLQHCQEHLRARVEEDCIREGYGPPASKA